MVLQLAKRFVLSKSSDGFLSLITWVSVVGVALGVLALVVVTSVINGFEGELARVITGMNGDVILYSKGEVVSEPEQVLKRLKENVPEAQAITPAFITELMVAGGNGVAAGAFLEGVDPPTFRSVTQVADRVIEGRLPEGPGEVALGSFLAEKIEAGLGEEVRILIPDTETAQPRSVVVRVVGFIRMGMFEYDSKYVFTTLEAAQKIVLQDGKATAFKLKLRPGVSSAKISSRLSEQFGYPYRAKNWAELNHNLFYAIQLEKAAIAVILTVIVIVAAFNVVSTLMMMIHDKAKEIAILKAMGLRPAQGFQLFVVIGVGMGLVGTVFGVCFGLGINQILAHTRLIDLPPDIYYISFLPVKMRVAEVMAIAGVAISISFLATLYPALKVSRQPPLEGIRYES